MDPLTKVLTVLGAVSGVCTALHLAFEGCAKIWPEVAWLKKASDWSGLVGVWATKIVAAKGGTK